MNIKYVTDTLKGIKRNKNQDSVQILENENYSFFMLFDGVSSLPKSYLFIQEFKNKILSNLNFTEITYNNLSQILYECHQDIITKDIDGMSTFSALFFDKKKETVKFSNIGDSRVYIFSNQFIEQVSCDDSFKSNENIITKCLGLDTLEVTDFNFYNIDHNSNFLICTDGFYKLMHDNLDEYFNALNLTYLKSIEKKLKSLQLKRNNDDSTYILIKR